MPPASPWYHKECSATDVDRQKLKKVSRTKVVMDFRSAGHPLGIGGGIPVVMPCRSGDQRSGVEATG